MQLSDGGILALREQHPDLIDPFLMPQLQPATYDLRLANSIILFRQNPDDESLLDPEDGTQEYHIVRFKLGIALALLPGQFILGSTVESVHIPPTHAARIEGKSSLGRLGLIVHSTAGFVDPGFKGNLTLEITNINHTAIVLRPRMLIAQLSITALNAPALRAYGSPELGSHYQNQEGVQPQKV